MSDVRVVSLPYERAALGAVNPLPDFHNVSYVHSSVAWDDTLTPEDVRYMRYGRIQSILPYLTQDGYDRARERAELPTVVVENAHIRAEFLPWMGGRLWSLKADGRELLYRNPVVQPCNLALRNAWCAGGVEWNVSIRGHNLLTCEPLFTELLRFSDGTAGVRFYEYERVRGVVYAVEAYLPPESRVLFVQTRVTNPRGNGETPMYWWSNIAVPQREGTRVIAPAETAIVSLYDAGKYRMLRTPLPEYAGMDVSRPTEIRRSIDVFFDLKAGARPFIAALQPDHRGLVQTSTREMVGRKLFVWGVGQGGRHWQEFLSDGSESYIEVQAGIARTQQDHLPMPDGAVWSWLEAYGQLSCDVDGLDWREAAAACERALDGLISREALDAERESRGQVVARAHGELASLGAGWGALENLRRAKEGLPPVDDVCRFPEESMTAAQDAWRALLAEGRFPDGAGAVGAVSGAPVSVAPISYLVAAPWRELLERAPDKGWAALYQLGVARQAAGDTDGAEAALRESVARAENPWALRGLARLAAIRGEMGECLALYGQALWLAGESAGGAPAPSPACRALALEFAQAFLAANQPNGLRAFLAAMPDALRESPRFRYLDAAASVALSDFARAEAILTAPLVIPDMCEGELSLCELWFALHEKREGIDRAEAERRFPLPWALDFRMHEA